MPRLYRVRIASSGWGGAPGLNTLYYRDAANPESTNDVDAAAACAQVRYDLSLHTDIFPAAHVFQVSGVVDVISDLDGELVESYASADPSPIAGSGTGDYGPQAAMICGSELTDSFVSGHRVRGRAFWGPMKALNDADGTPTSDLVASITQLMVDLRTTGGSYQQVVWSRPRVAQPDHVPPIAARAGSNHVISSSLVRDTWAVLRSRRA